MAGVKKNKKNKRRYVRINLPALVEINKIFYDTIDWSEGGISVAWDGMGYLKDEIKVHNLYSGRLIFSFGEFDLGLPAELEALYIDVDHDKVGFEFVKMSKTRKAIMKKLVESAEAGRLVDIDEMFDIIESSQSNSVLDAKIVVKGKKKK